MLVIKKLVIAHRGASFYRPENTLAAFELAYQQGADGIETDIQLSKDSIPMIIHDANINRVTHATGNVNQWSSEKLKTFDIGSWFDLKYQSERMMTLTDLLQWAKEKNLLLNLELKTKKNLNPNIEQIVYQEVIQHGLLDQVIFSSFNSATLKKLKQLNSETRVALLTKRHTLSLQQMCEEFHFDGIHLKYNYVNRTVTEKYHRIGKYLGVYTVNISSQMRKCFQANCDMIITDRPDLAIEKRHLFF